MTMGEIQAVLESPNKVTIFLTVIAAFVAIQFLLKLLDYFTSRFGIETKTSLDKKKTKAEIDAIKSEMDQVRETQKKMLESQDKIIAAVDKLDKREIKNEIERKRYLIIDFANAIHCRKYDREAYSHVLKTYNEYEQILKDNNMENGEADMAIAFIRKKYAEYMETGFPEY